MRLLVGLCALLALSVGVATAKTNNGNAPECKKGGWKTWYRADGTAFKNQGQCIAYVNHGGVLTRLPDLVLIPSCTQKGTAVGCVFQTKNIGQGSVTSPVEMKARLEWPSTVPGFPIASSGHQASCLGPAANNDLDANGAGHYSYAEAVCDGTFAAGTLLGFDVGVDVINITESGLIVTVTASVDPGNTVAESNETNNTFSQTFIT